MAAKASHASVAAPSFAARLSQGAAAISVRTASRRRRVRSRLPFRRAFAQCIALRRPPNHIAGKEGRMRAVIQRVSRASVTVEGRVAGEIAGGLMVLLGVG